MPGPADYWSVDQDPYIDKETGILRNIPGFDSEEELENFEKIIYQAHMPEAYSLIAAKDKFNLKVWQEIHQICFGEVYDWAGELRTVRIEKTPTVFAYPEHIETEAAKLFSAINEKLANGSLTREEAAEYYAELNVIHPFREGNGRTQRIIFSEILKRIGYRVDYSLIEQDELITALIKAYQGDYTDITALFEKITTKI